MSKIFTLHLLQGANPTWWQRWLGFRLPFREADYLGYQPIELPDMPVHGQVVYFPECYNGSKKNFILGLVLCSEGQVLKLQLLSYPHLVEISAAITPRLKWEA